MNVRAAMKPRVPIPVVPDRPVLPIVFRAIAHVATKPRANTAVVDTFNQGKSDSRTGVHPVKLGHRVPEEPRSGLGRRGFA